MKNEQKIEIKSGMPTKDPRGEKNVRIIILFSILGVSLAVGIIWLQGLIGTIDDSLRGSDSYVLLTQMGMGVFVSVFASIVEMLIFKSKIKSRYSLYIFSAVIGGIIGSIVLTLIYNASVDTGFILGGALGVVSGAISSGIQTQLMKLNRNNFRWITFSTLCWGISFALGWSIGWEGEILELALGAATLLVSVGLSMVIFLSTNPDIEFS